MATSPRAWCKAGAVAVVTAAVLLAVAGRWWRAPWPFASVLFWGTSEPVWFTAVEEGKRALFSVLTVLLWDVYYKWYWGQRHPADICAQQTTMPATFWHQHLAECNDSLRVHFESFLTPIATAVMVVWSAWCLRSVVWYLFIFLPTLCVRHAHHEPHPRHTDPHGASRVTPRTQLITRLLERLTPRRALPGPTPM